MSERDIQHLEFILEKIDIIFEICEIGIEEALSDYKRDRPAILMHLEACFEQFQKLSKKGCDLSGIIDPDKLKGLRNTRNFIAHNYEGVNLKIIKRIIEGYLPEVKDNIQKYLDEIQKEKSSVSPH